MIVIVVIKPTLELRHDHFCVGTIVDIDIIPLKGFNKRFSHPVRLWTTDWYKTGGQPELLAKINRFFCCIG